MNVNKVSLSKYLDLMHGAEPDLIYVMSVEFGDSTRYEKAANAVATTWIVTFEQLARQDSVALDLLRYMSCIEWKAIPHSILPLTKP